eukprot:gnl/TRDRNA2_/TRDRNA2_171716_c1_seq1.p1 gnl/TRDRNA2_/TRDRNA2_171716_c1~~gnl/TRDRNA2_/TRDRNA2_171716_c1_seq1.p1  ORF type:complete len:160 (-),score=23.83 gnl/TRDRNA2_/TRDRNA2_171716_c1_seq1:449-928(-)
MISGSVATGDIRFYQDTPGVDTDPACDELALMQIRRLTAASASDAWDDDESAEDRGHNAITANLAGRLESCRQMWCTGLIKVSKFGNLPFVMAKSRPGAVEKIFRQATSCCSTTYKEMARWACQLAYGMKMATKSSVSKASSTKLCSSAERQNMKEWTK